MPYTSAAAVSTWLLVLEPLPLVLLLAAVGVTAVVTSAGSGITAVGGVTGGAAAVVVAESVCASVWAAVLLAPAAAAVVAVSLVVLPCVKTGLGLLPAAAAVAAVSSTAGCGEAVPTLVDGVLLVSELVLLVSVMTSSTASAAESSCPAGDLWIPSVAASPARLLLLLNLRRQWDDGNSFGV